MNAKTIRVQGRAIRAFARLMVVLLPASVMATDSVGLMTVTGSVLLDRQAAAAGSSAIFDGDRIDTNAGGKAVITRPGASIAMHEKSSIVFDRQRINLDAGTIVVSARHGIVTKVDNTTITIRPGEMGRFLARKIDGEVQVLTLEGQVYVGDGLQQAPVPATKGVGVSGKSASGQAGKLTWLSNPDIGILIVVAAAVVAGVTLGVVNAENNKAASPSVP